MARRAPRTRSRGRQMPQSAEAGLSSRKDIGGRSPERSGSRQEIHCALCQRDVDRVTVHHLVPRARGGNHGPTARMCPTCHRQVHAMFSVTTLAEELYSIELLRANPRVADFLRWMRKQRGASFSVRRARERS